MLTILQALNHVGILLRSVGRLCPERRIIHLSIGLESMLLREGLELMPLQSIESRITEGRSTPLLPSHCCSYHSLEQDLPTVVVHDAVRDLRSRRRWKHSELKRMMMKGVYVVV